MPSLASDEVSKEEATPLPPTSELLAQFWELNDKDKRGVYTLRTYRSNYVLPYYYSSNINKQPSTRTRGPVEEGSDYQSQDVKLEFSFRTKVLEDFLLPNGDLWLAYTQTSLWQAWNKDISHPFRSADHSPDVGYVSRVSQTFGLIPGNLGHQM